MVTLWTRLTKKRGREQGHCTRDLLGIGAIKRDMIILRRHRYRAIIKVGSVNTDLMTDFEQQVFDQKFGQLLNSMNFPLQFVVRPKKSELFPYIRQIEQAQRQAYAGKYSAFLQDHAAFVGEIARVHQAIERPKWIVVPYDGEAVNSYGYDDSELYHGKVEQPDEQELSQAQAQLGNRCDLVAQALRKLELTGQRLNTRELFSLCFDFFNPNQVGVVEQIFANNEMARVAVEGTDCSHD